eukprot:4303866-Pyramimonas_sp.AAC.1
MRSHQSEGPLQSSREIRDMWKGWLYPRAWALEPVRLRVQVDLQAEAGRPRVRVRQPPGG